MCGYYLHFGKNTKFETFLKNQYLLNIVQNTYTMEVTYLRWSYLLLRMHEDCVKHDHPTLLSEEGSCRMSVEGPFILNML